MGVLSLYAWKTNEFGHVVRAKAGFVATKKIFAA